MLYQYNDGGRAAAGFETKNVFDCVARSIAIASGKPYAEVWHFLANNNAADGKKRSADHCVRTGSKWFFDYMVSIGFSWVNLKPIGKAPKAYFNKFKLPTKGRLIIATRDHYAAFVDGVLNDTYLWGENGRTQIIGYWAYKSITKLYDVYKDGVKINRYAMNEKQANTMRDLYALNYGGVIDVRPNDLL